MDAATYHYVSQTITEGVKGKVTTSDIFSRIENLRIKTDRTWAQMSDVLGLGVSMLMMVKSGKRGLSAKALYRLENAEREAGIAPPKVSVEEAVELAHVQPDDVAEMRRRDQAVRQLDTIIARVEKDLGALKSVANFLRHPLERPHGRATKNPNPR